ncbi:sulfotransferase [Xanthomarina sp. F1114]|uniref:sulfotransferase family protein n=1 Tax=Flavobacteriaceae TaxID=49546 RepID=UPI00225E007F|nr:MULTISPECIES: sulfotransferase [Flavobacteriaceae]MCX7546561.1 sulfotransferase [Xanthomarina sp. F1114]MDX1772975.1 sulfotransferase [Oceanihabitans sediminis]
MINNKKTFFCIGAQKSGTTSLHDILLQNPNIGLPVNKETHFFSHDELYTGNLDDYFKMFNEGLNKKEIIGEIDPEYLCSDKAPERIFKHFGADIKFIVILRNPYNRAYSQYLMSKRRGFEELDFEEAIEKEETRIKDNFGKLYFSYKTRSLYSNQINNYFKYFNSSNFLFIRFEEDFIGRKQETITKVNEFLGLEPFNYDLSIQSNVASTPKSKLVRDFVNRPNIVRKMGKKIIPSPQLRKNIIDKIDSLNKKKISYNTNLELKEKLTKSVFLDDIKTLESLINLDLSSWYKNE